jgi:hypothetical protein
MIPQKRKLTGQLLIRVTDFSKEDLQNKITSTEQEQENAATSSELN